MKFINIYIDESRNIWIYSCLDSFFFLNAIWWIRFVANDETVYKIQWMYTHVKKFNSLKTVIIKNIYNNVSNKA